MLPSWDIFRTPEEREEEFNAMVRRYYLEKGRGYTYEIERRREYGEYFHIYEITIKQTECPWSNVCTHRCRTRIGAHKWAKDYLKRGGPPEGYFDIKPDPHAMTYEG